ncbi:MAG: hypothetical protein EAX96_15855 [Candidatus Lokiarchaeota archaeon]|nr:hypothetical protein [Candidatus Lokiarchaeota archaeon]
MARERACRQCHRIFTEPQCPNCKSTNISTSYSGVVIIIQPDKSYIAKRLGITNPGKYALKVR